MKYLSKYIKNFYYRSDLFLIWKSGIFDSVWYLNTYPEVLSAGQDPIEHYLLNGGFEGYNPHPLFDSDFYIQQNVDVAIAKINPLVHYLKFGAKEGRDPHPLFLTSWYTRFEPGSIENPLINYIKMGWSSEIDPHPLMMSSYYKSQVAEWVSDDITPLAHYLLSGERDGLKPNPLFDPRWYSLQYSDLLDLTQNKLVHYRLFSGTTPVNPSALFDSIDYLRLHPDVRREKSLTALGHYLRYGVREGRALSSRSVSDRDLVNDNSNKFENKNIVNTLDIVGSLPNTYSDWLNLCTPGEGILLLQRRQASVFDYKPLISLILPVYKISVEIIRSLIESIEAQTYPYWELCVSQAWTEDAELNGFLRMKAEADSRIKLNILDQNYGISENSNAALKLASGEYIGLIDHDDMISPNALFEMAVALNDNPDIDFLYSDKDSTDTFGSSFFNPLFKPEWSPELMLSVNYLTHFNVLRTSRVREIGGWNKDTDGAQDWDLFLRFIGPTTKVRAVRRPLYHWRVVPTSVASGIEAKPWAANSQLRALTNYLESNSWAGCKATFAAKDMIRIKWNLDFRPRILVVCIGDTQSAEGPGWESVKLATLNSPLIAHVEYLQINSSDFVNTINSLVANSDADVIVTIDASCRPNADWLHELVGPLQNEALSVVGGRLESPDGRLLEGGWVFPEGRPVRLFRGEDNGYWGVFTGTWCCRNLLAVGGGLAAFRRTSWSAVGGISNSPSWGRHDLDLCLRIVSQGSRIMLNTYARATISKESIFSNDSELLLEPSIIFSKLFPSGDPFFHPSLVILNEGRPELKIPQPQNNINYFEEARYTSVTYDAPSSAFNHITLSRSETRLVRHIAWFVPKFDMPFYGGIHTILRAADHMWQHHKIRQTFVVLGVSNAELLRPIVARAFPHLAKDAEFISISSVDVPCDLVDVDAAIATLWTTAYAVRRLDARIMKFYFIQDNEPLFYPAGTTYKLAEATYRFGFHGICNTYPLRRIYEEYGGRADHFLPAVDSSIFHNNGRIRRKKNEPFLVFSYARPGHPRNCFESIMEGLVELKKRMKDRVRIITAGANWNPKEYGFSQVVEHMGILSYAETGNLYRTVDLGVVAMATSHPSYLPFELMACGALVASNYNINTTWLLRDNENCVLFELTRSAIADEIESLLLDSDKQNFLREGGIKTIAKNYSDWSLACEQIAKIILGKQNEKC